jgi:hypothetical protein
MKQLIGGGSGPAITAVPAGTAAAPSIAFEGDSNTGIYSPGADTLAFVEGGAEAVRTDSSGRLLVGTSSSVTGGLLEVNGRLTGTTIDSLKLSINTTSGAQNVTASAAGQHWIFIYSDTDNRLTMGIAYWAGTSTPIELNDSNGVFSWSEAGGFIKLNGGARALEVTGIRLR